MIQKVLALDLPACLIRPYLSIDDSQKRNRYESPFWPLYTSPTPSNFLVENMESESTDSEWGPFIYTVVSHTQSSLGAAFITLLRATDLPDCSPNATWLIACDCVDYLKEVVTRADWRENTLVQELRNPKPKGMELFMEIFQQYVPQDLKRYVYKSLVSTRNAIVEREDHPFQDLLGDDETNAALSDDGGELVA
jgi:hypothetical protein